MTGIELIAEERREQIEKHGFSVANDWMYYKNGELKQAALFYLNPSIFAWPDSWDEGYYKDKIALKDEINKLRVAGALIAAEIDRLLPLETTAL